ncbi:protein takeout-like [Macrosteles quadrilineatus]|uniref:protein takeout-like n=1 Tax=Macrosteles quadrilineatus TaxID=74068 RepID=UPI0023E0BBDA|nr:protein takeout-like [Macrosteles quadrilineatus]
MMTPRVYLVAVVASALIASALAAAASKLPKDFKRCKKHDPKLNDCLKDAIQKALVSLEKGAPSLGVLTIDPLRVSSLTIDQGSGPVSIKLDFKNLDIHGLASAKLDKVKVDWDKYSIEAEVTVPKPVRLMGNYKINGKVLILPIQGNGLSNLTLESVKAKLTLKGKGLKKNGQEHMDVEKMKLEFTTQKLHISLSNLFNGDKRLGDNMNTFLNENWQDILKELQPAIEEALGQTFRIVANRIFHKVPLNQIYIE